jgi:hypothetical protein
MIFEVRLTSSVVNGSGKNYFILIYRVGAFCQVKKKNFDWTEN